MESFIALLYLFSLGLATITAVLYHYALYLEIGARFLIIREDVIVILLPACMVSVKRFIQIWTDLV